jgi:hypothetical protein
MYLIHHAQIQPFHVHILTLIRRVMLNANQSVKVIPAKANNSTCFHQKNLINLLTIYGGLEVFISSTIVDLKEEREAVEEVMKLFHISSFRSECFMASPYSPKELCLTKASECDIFIGIYKGYYYE